MCIRVRSAQISEGLSKGQLQAIKVNKDLHATTKAYQPDARSWAPRALLPAQLQLNQLSDLVRLDFCPRGRGASPCGLSNDGEH